MATDWYKGWADEVVYTHECPNCGIESDVHIGEMAGDTEKPNFCPVCGTMVVD